MVLLKKLNSNKYMHFLINPMGEIWEFGNIIKDCFSHLFLS